MLRIRTFAIGAMCQPVILLKNATKMLSAENATVRAI